MRGKAIPLSPMRRFVTDLLHFASGVPTVPVERRMDLHELARERAARGGDLSWTAIFTRAYARVADRMPERRRPYIQLPLPHLCEFPTGVATIALEREWRGEKCVVFGRVKDPAGLTLEALSDLIRGSQQLPVDQCKPFRQALRLSSAPRPLRR